MAATTTTVTAITDMVRERMEAVPLDTIVGQLTPHSVQYLVEQLAIFMSHLATTKWGGNQRFLPLVLSNARMRPATRNINLDCKRLKNPEIIKPRIKYITQGRDIFKLQADQKVK